MIRGVATKAVCDERDTMPNKNYQKGVLLEREIVNYFKNVGCHAARTAGSHGKYDLYAIGTVDQINMGWDKLEIAGFRMTTSNLVRTTVKYTDTLYLFEVSDSDNMALFIQCKRKLK